MGFLNHLFAATLLTVGLVMVLATPAALAQATATKKVTIKTAPAKNKGTKKIIPIKPLQEKSKTKSGKLKFPPKAPKLPPKKAPGTSWQLHSGNDYLEFPAYDRTNYIAGLSDAYNWSYSGGFEKMKWLVECSRGKPTEQLTAMFDKWMQQNPERWDEPAAKLYPFAMFDLCRAKPKAAKSTK